MLPENEDQLDLLLSQPRRRRMVHQEGITFLGGWYMHALLAGLVGSSVIIRYDPLNLAEIRVYEAEQGESFLCRAQCVERGGQATSLQEIVAERTKRRKAVGKSLRKRKQVVARHASPEQLAQRALEGANSLSPLEITCVPPQTQEEVISASSEMVPQVCTQPKIRWYDDE